MSQLEKYSTIFIKLNRQPMFIIDNDFEDNIGTFGSSISIDSPNFVSDYSNKTSVAERPHIVID